MAATPLAEWKTFAAARVGAGAGGGELATDIAAETQLRAVPLSIVGGAWSTIAVSTISQSSSASPWECW